MVLTHWQCSALSVMQKVPEHSASPLCVTVPRELAQWFVTTLGHNGSHGSTQQWFSFPQLQLMVVTPGIFLGCRTQVPVLPSRSGWKNYSVVWKAETSGSLREVAFSFCSNAINMCICAMYSYTSRTWYLNPRAQRRCFGKAAPVVMASSYHHLCSSSTRRCGVHKTGTWLKHGVCWWNLEEAARESVCTGGYVLFTF